MNRKTTIVVMCALIAACATAWLSLTPSSSAAAVVQSKIGARKAPLLKVDGLTFKDLNKNGVLDKYEDWRLPIDQRIADLVSKMTLEEKAGLLLHPNIAVSSSGVIPQTEEEMRAYLQSQPGRSGAGAAAGGRGAAAGRGGQQGGAGGGFGQMAANAPPPRVYIVDRNIRSILNNGVAPPEVFARWSNGMQEIAEATRLGIPILFSSDPRHGRVGGHVSGAQYFSQGPGGEGASGIGASNDPNVARNYGRVIAEEYRAVGLHMILGPALDLATDPSGGGSFSESAELTSTMIKAFLEGAQDGSAQQNRVMVMSKHYQNTGTKKSVAIFNYHLIPYKAAADAGSLAVMCGYGTTSFENGLQVCYSRNMITEFLRGKAGFKGAVTTDWGVVGRMGPLREDVKDLSLKDRYKMLLEAGTDQAGSENDPTPIIEDVKEGKLSESRINEAASRILQWHFRLGLFEDPYVDPAAAPKIVNSEKNRKLAHEAQVKAVILLTNDGTLPLAEKKLRVYVSGIDAEVAKQYADVVSEPKGADVAILRVPTAAARAFMPGPAAAPGGERTIELPQETMAQIKAVTDTGVRTVVALNGGSAVVLPKELFKMARATLMHVEIDDSALLDVVFGKYNPTGKLPIELPSSMEAVRNQDPEVAFDSKEPLFRFGYGLSYTK